MTIGFSRIDAYYRLFIVPGLDVSLSPQMGAVKTAMVVLTNTVQNERYMSGIFDNEVKFYNK